MELTKQYDGVIHKGPPIKKQRNLSEIIEYFDSHWKVPVDNTLQRMKLLDKAFDFPSRQLPAILVAGTNGKSITAHFASKLFVHEGLTVGTFSSPHILLYKERFGIDLKSMPSRIFTEIGNEVIAAAEDLNIQAHSAELLTLMALVYFKRNNVDVAIFEVASMDGAGDPVNIVNAKVATITRVTPTEATASQDTVLEQAARIATIVKPNMKLVSGDQSKATLNLLQNVTKELGGIWVMPVRKLANLPYPNGQLLGRCAALAERVASLFMEEYVEVKDVTSEAVSLFARTTGKRGRPTLEEKRKQEVNPRKTIDHFWKETECTLPGKFQVLDKEKPTILLDTAKNCDALESLLCGIRLIHYRRPLKGLVIIIGATKNTLYGDEFLKMIRYFFKKTVGQIFICPPGEAVPGTSEDVSWDIEQVANDIKGMKVKARAFSNFDEALHVAKGLVDEKYGLVVITGSQSVVASYWKNKGVKKF